MATETVEITLPGLTGFTLTAKLYADGSNTLVDTIATLTEATNRKGTYTGTTATGATGLHLVVALEGTTVRGEGYANLRNSATGVTVVGSRSDVMLGPPAGASIAADIAAIQVGLGSLGTGTGARTVTITVNDGLAPVQNARVRVSEGVNTYTGLTNVSGVVVFNLDDATYTVAITKAGYTYAGTTLVVDGSETVTYSITSIIVTPAADPSQSTLSITCYDENLAVEEDVEMHLTMVTIPDGDTGVSFDGKTKILTSDANGLIEVTVVRLAEYVIQRADSYDKRVRVLIPDAATCLVESVIGKESI